MSVNVIIGEIEKFNRYHLEDIKDKYNSALIVEKVLYTGLRKWIRNINRPIIGGRILVIVTDPKILRREFDNCLKLFGDYRNHPFIDIVWHISETRGDFQTVISEIDCKFLIRTRKDDLIKYVNNIVNDKDISVYILNRIAFNWNKFTLYEDIFRKTQIKLTENEVNKIILVKVLAPITQIIEGILLGKRLMIRDYYLLCDKYSKRWVDDFIQETLLTVINLKIKYFKSGSQLKLYEIKSNDKTRKYYDLIVKTNISSVYALYNLMQVSNFPIEIFCQTSVSDVIHSLGTDF